MISEEITADLKKGLSLEDTLVKHGTNLKELFSVSKPKKTNTSKPAKKIKYSYYDRRNNMFTIARTINGRRVYFGTYKSEEAARLAVSLFEKYGWNKEYNWRVKAEVKEILGERY